MNIWARYSSRQQDTKHHSTLYHIQNELALHGETGTLIQCEGSCLLSKKQQMNNWRHNSTGYRMILLQVTATEWCAPTGAAVFTPCPLKQIKPNIYQVSKILKLQIIKHPSKYYNAGTFILKMLPPSNFLIFSMDSQLLFLLSCILFY